MAHCTHCIRSCTRNDSCRGGGATYQARCAASSITLSPTAGRQGSGRGSNNPSWISSRASQGRQASLWASALHTPCATASRSEPSRANVIGTLHWQIGSTCVESTGPSRGGPLAERPMCEMRVREACAGAGTARAQTPSLGLGIVCWNGAWSQVRKGHEGERGSEDECVWGRVMWCSVCIVLRCASYAL